MDEVRYKCKRLNNNLNFLFVFKSKSPQSLNSLIMESIKEFLNRRVIPGLYALLFVVGLLLLSILLVRRQIYF
jgi:hypothetical protein